ncbi:MAG TPA: UDP-N-acetylmuramate dehydrogenase [Roseiflexaceae bacterium]|nr:UDP-N-acetylmuramate dehydrogenase [Roseiflexaceae bacterium]
MTIAYIENEPLAKYTSWRIGGPARYFAAVPTAEALAEALRWARERELPATLLGGGTNVLVLDSGFPGLVLRLRAQELRIDETAGVAWVAAGAPMAGTARRLAAQGWAGLEWAEGLPGTIGGAVFGNAGCYGGDIASTLARAWLLIDGETQEWSVERFAYGYRTSTLKATNAERRTPNDGPAAVNSFALGPSSLVGPIVLAAEFRISRADPRELSERMAQTAAERRGKTPVGSSCGSVFKNPHGNSAGRLIESAGLKGTRVGSAEISHQHGNYIVNRGGASSDDILRLVEIARERVLREHGIGLELEVQLIG